MLRYTVKRILQGVLAFFGVSIIVFAASRASGDVVALLIPLDESDESIIQEVRDAYGLNEPIWVQYGIFLKNATRGDFGRSYRWQEPSMHVVLSRMPATLQLTVVTALISGSLALILGTLSAINRGTWVDKTARMFAIGGQSSPEFFTGLMLVILFTLTWDVLPPAGRGGISHWILPVFTLGWYSMASVTRLSRSCMLNVLDMEYIKMAKAKGLPYRLVFWKHALKNAFIPVLTLMGFTWADLIGGSVIVETIFAWPGMGSTMVQAVLSRDYNVVQAAVIIFASWIILVNLAVDLLYGVIDPRIRYT